MFPEIDRLIRPLKNCGISEDEKIIFGYNLFVLHYDDWHVENELSLCECGCGKVEFKD